MKTAKIMSALQRVMLTTVLFAVVGVSSAQAQFSDRFEFLRAIEKADYLETRQRLDNGVYINTHNSDGISALMLASQTSGPPWTKLLLDRDADPDIRNESDGRTAMMFYAERGNKLGVELMLSFKAEVDVQDDLGETALMKAVRAAELRIVQMLLKSEPDLYLTDSTGRDVFDISLEMRRSGKSLAITKALKAAL